MATQATYIGVTPRTVIANSGNADIGRGLRVVKASDGTVALADNTVRGDFITLTSIEAGKPGEAVSMQSAGKIPAVASEAVTAGDTAYTATNGQCSKTSASNVLIGKWATTTASGALGEVELINPL